MKSTPSARKDWPQVLTIINQIGQTLTTSLHTMDIKAICRSILSNLTWEDLFVFDAAEICLWDTQTKVLTSVLRIPENDVVIQAYDHDYHLNEGYTGWIAANQTPLLISDTRSQSDILPKAASEDFPYQSVIGVPLKVGLKLLGTLELLATAPNAYTELDITILELITNQAAITIDHVRLFQETQRNVSELALLFDVSSELSSTLSYNELLQNLSRQMLNAFPADECVVFSVDEATATLKLLHRYTMTEMDATQDETNYLECEILARSIIQLPAWQETFKSRTPLILRLNETEAIDSKIAETLRTLEHGAVITIPLVNRDKVTGLLMLFSPEPYDFTEYQVQLAQSLANQANIALDNARLFSLTDQELQSRVDELAGLQRVSRESNSTLDLDKILRLILEEAMQVTGAKLGAVNLYDASTGALVAQEEQGELDLSPADIEMQSNILAQVLHTGRTILIDDILQEPGYNGQSSNSRSIVVIPIYYGGEPVGVINLESKRPYFFNKNQLRYLEALANQAAVAIGNAQAFQEQKREREQASRRVQQLSRLSEISNAFRTNRPLKEVLEDIAYAILESVGYKVVLISLVNPNQRIYHEISAGIPLTDFRNMQSTAQPLSRLLDILQDQFKIGQTYFIPVEHKAIWQDKLHLPYIGQHALSLSKNRLEKKDPWQNGDLLLVPLKDTEDNFIGLLTVEEPDNGERPYESTTQTLEIFASQAANAIENARLFEREQHRRRVADTLRGVAEAISSQLDLDELLNVVLQELSKVVEFDSASIQQLQDDQVVIIGGLGWQDREQVIGISFPMEGFNPNRVVIETQEPLIIGNAREAYPDTFGPPHDEINSWLGVPLTYGTNILGLMALDSSQEHFFTDEQAQVALAFANQVAVAMQNALLFEGAKNQVRQLAALTDVAQALNRELDLSEVLDLVLESVFDLVSPSQGTIWLVDPDTNTLKIANTKNIPDFMVELFNESSITIDSEPFASIIQSGEIQIVAGSREWNDFATSHASPLPNDVTYVPLKTEDGVIGLLALESIIDNKNMLELVSTLASMAAIAIDNAQLIHRLNLFNEELEQRVAQRTEELAQTLQDFKEERDRFETLYQITRELSTSFDLDRILTQALHLINQAVGISHGSILLLDRDTEQLVYRTALDDGKPLPRGGYETEYRMGHGLAGMVMENRELRIVPDLLNDPDWVPKKKRSLQRRSAIAAPLISGEEVVGALMLYHHEENYFTESHVKLVEAAGTQVANAINNAELYRLITDQAKRLGMMLRTEAAEAAKSEAILNSITDGVLVLNSDYQVVLLNPKGAEILEVDSTSLEKQAISGLISQEFDDNANELRELFYNKLMWALEQINSGSSSAEFRIEVNAKALIVTVAPASLASDELPSIVAVLRDISREAEIDRIRKEFISTVSHELRTPMTSIKGYADLLMSANAQVGELNPTQSRFIQVIQSNANRLTGLVNDILEISRIETGRIELSLEVLDIVDIIKEVAVSFEGQLVKKSVNFSIDIDDQLLPVYADKNRLIQILVNLIGNAWQYTPEDGDVAVRATRRDDNFIQVDVSDTGIGIVEKDLEYVFDRFFRSERTEVQVVDGTGLGLSITKSFVDMLGGEIWVESEIDVGSTFSFTLPVAEVELVSSS